MNVYIDAQKMCFSKRNEYDANTDNEPINFLTDQNTLNFENLSSNVFQNDEEDIKWKLPNLEYVTDYPNDYLENNLIRVLVGIIECYVALVEKNDVWAWYEKGIPINYL